jgi:hypothetical protein
MTFKRLGATESEDATTTDVPCLPVLLFAANRFFGLFLVAKVGSGER